MCQQGQGRVRCRRCVDSDAAGTCLEGHVVELIVDDTGFGIFGYVYVDCLVIGQYSADMEQGRVLLQRTLIHLPRWC